MRSQSLAQVAGLGQLLNALTVPLKDVEQAGKTSIEFLKSLNHWTYRTRLERHANFKGSRVTPCESTRLRTLSEAPPN